VQRLLETLDLLVSLFLGSTIALLQLAGKILLVALATIEIVIGELAPTGSSASLSVASFALDDVPVHGRTSLQLGRLVKAIMDASGGNRRRRSTLRAGMGIFRSCALPRR
jgi:hypothetical protein